MYKMLYILIFSTLLFSCSDSEKSEGLAYVKVGGKWGYINKEGKMVITPQFDAALDFLEGMAMVLVGDKVGYINKEGEMVINPQFDSALSFSEGMASVLVGDKMGYINKEGKMVINPQFVFFMSFSEGLAYTKVGDKSDGDISTLKGNMLSTHNLTMLGVFRKGWLM